MRTENVSYSLDPESSEKTGYKSQPDGWKTLLSRLQEIRHVSLSFIIYRCVPESKGVQRDILNKARSIN